MATSNDLNISQPGYVAFDGTATFTGRTFQAGTGISLTNPDGISGNTTITASGANDLHTASFIVSSAGTTGTGANFTNITAAIASAVGTGLKSTIFIMPGLTGTYTENFTLPANINLTAFACDSTTPNVTIIGNITCTGAGSRSISNIRLQTNSAAFLTVSANAAIVVNLNNCFLNCTNNTGISYSSASASSVINIFNCTGDIATTGIALFAFSGIGTSTFRNINITNTGSSTTANTISAGLVNIFSSFINNPITTSSTGGLGIYNSLIYNTPTNTTSLTLGGSGNTFIEHTSISSGSASAISCGSATPYVVLCDVSSSNTNCITGSGTLNYGYIDFTGTSRTINTTTQIEINSGTWTPTLIGGSVAGSTAYSIQNGYYTRVGGLCWIQFEILTTSQTGTGNVNIGGLPFTIKNNSNGNTYGSCSVNGITWPATSTMVQLIGIPNNTFLNIQGAGSAVTVGLVQMANVVTGVQGTMVFQIA